MYLQLHIKEKLMARVKQYVKLKRLYKVSKFRDFQQGMFVMKACMITIMVTSPNCIRKHIEILNCPQ